MENEQTPETNVKRPNDPTWQFFYKITGAAHFPRHKPIWLGYKRPSNKNVRFTADVEQPQETENK